MSRTTGRKAADRGPIPDRYREFMRERLADEAELEAFLAACARPLPTTLRFNPQRCGALNGEVPTGLDLALEPLDLPATAYRLAGGGDPGRSLEHALGLFYLQDFASMIPATVVERLAPELPRRALDLCAAPGSKSTQLATLLAPGAILLANELQGSRAGVLVANLLRCGVARALVSQLDGREIGARMPESFDVVLVDAPCSGEGTIRRDRQALEGWRPDRNRKLPALQKELIASGWAALAPGGLLVYSTCTHAPGENEEVVDHLLATSDAVAVDLGPAFPELERSLDGRGRLQVFPHHHDSGGFFVAALRKPGRLEPVELALPAIEVEAERALADRYGLDLETLGLRALRRGQDFFLVPIGAGALIEGLPLARPGFRAGRFEIDGFEPDHELALVLGSNFRHDVVELDREQARRYLAGLQVDLELAVDPTLLRWQGLPLGFAATRQGRFRNLLPRHFVRNIV